MGVVTGFKKYCGLRIAGCGLKTRSAIQFAIRKKFTRRGGQFAIAFAAMLVAGASARAAGPERVRACWAGVDDAINSAVAWESIPGAVLLVGQGDKVVYRKAYGH